MPWAIPHKVGAGTTQQIEDAHSALDDAGIPAGPLAVRVIAAVALLQPERDRSAQPCA